MPTLLTRNAHLLLPARTLITTARTLAEHHTLQPEALMIFATHTLLSQAPGSLQAYQSYCLHLWSQAKA